MYCMHPNETNFKRGLVITIFMYDFEKDFFFFSGVTFYYILDPNHIFI